MPNNREGLAIAKNKRTGKIEVISKKDTGKSKKDAGSEVSEGTQRRRDVVRDLALANPGTTYVVGNTSYAVLEHPLERRPVMPVTVTFADVQNPVNSADSSEFVGYSVHHEPEYRVSDEQAHHAYMETQAKDARKEARRARKDARKEARRAAKEEERAAEEADKERVSSWAEEVGRKADRPEYFGIGTTYGRPPTPEYFGGESAYGRPTEQEYPGGESAYRRATAPEYFGRESTYGAQWYPDPGRESTYG